MFYQKRYTSINYINTLVNKEVFLAFIHKPVFVYVL